MASVQFDRQQVLDSVTNLFWKSGLLGTSMHQVFKATGLKPGSVYLAFGNKEALFKQSLQNYSQRSMDSIHQVMEKAPSIGEGICDILQSMVDESQQPDYCGCFLVKSQLELAADHPKLHQFTREQLKSIEDVYTSYLSHLDASLAQTRAASLMFHIFGVRVYGYHQQPREQLLQVLHDGLPWLALADIYS